MDDNTKAAAGQALIAGLSVMATPDDCLDILLSAAISVGAVCAQRRGFIGDGQAMVLAHARGMYDSLAESRRNGPSPPARPDPDDAYFAHLASCATCKDAWAPTGSRLCERGRVLLTAFAGAWK